MYALLDSFKFLMACLGAFEKERFEKSAYSSILAVSRGDVRTF